MRHALPIGGPVTAGHYGKPAAWWRRALRSIGYAFLRASSYGVRTVNITLLDSGSRHFSAADRMTSEQVRRFQGARREFL